MIANVLGLCVDKIYSYNIGVIDPLAAWIAAIAYAFQIYYDFSGYSDMAIGLGKMFGFDYLENFNYPYLSKSVGEFWRRWHISLGTWFREYVYIPWAETGKGSSGPISTWPSSSSSPVCGTERTSPSSSGAPGTASGSSSSASACENS